MAEKIVLPSELARLIKSRNLDRVILVRPNRIRAVTSSGDIVNVEGRIRRHGSHVTIDSGTETVVVPLNSPAQQSKRSALWSITGLIATLVIGVLSIYQFTRDTPVPIKSKIEELERISKSLAVLSTYVDDQQRRLQETNKAINSLEDRKKTMEAIWPSIKRKWKPCSHTRSRKDVNRSGLN